MAQSKADLLNEIKKLQTEINELEKRGMSLTEGEIKLQEKLKNSIVRKAREVRQINEEQRKAQKDLINAIGEQESGLKSLTGMYAPIKEIEQQRVKALGESNIKSQHNVDVLGRAQAINEKIAGLTSTDVVQRQALNMELEQELNSLRGRGAALDYQKSLLMQSNALANQYAGLTEKQKDFLQKQIAVYDGIKDTIGGVLETASLLTSTMGGMIGISLIGLGKIATAAGEVRRQLGGMGDAGTTFVSFFDDNAVENTKALAGEFGSMNNISTKLQVSTSLISTNMGISGDEAASLIGSLSRGAASTKELSLDMIKSVQATAKLRGVLPSKVLKDLAGASKEFALYSKQGKLNLQQSAIAAGELGVDLSVLTGASAALLDFETSINAELELQALTGKTINLERARQLALAEDDIGAMQEVARQLGGIAGWEAMGRWERQQAADLLGIQADELEKIIYNQKEVATSGSVIKESFSAVGETINAGMNKYLGVGLQGLGGMVIAAGQLNGGFAAFGGSLKGAITGTAQILKNLLGMVAGPVLKGIQVVASTLSDSKLGKGIKSIKDKLLEGVGSKPQVPGADAAAGGPSKFMESVSKIKMSEVLKGAAALLVVAGAVFVFGKAVQEFMKVSWDAVGMAVVSMLALVGAVALLGAIMTSGVGAVAILAGAAAMLVVAASVLVLGYALQAIGTGFEMLSAGLTTLVPNLTLVGEAVSSMVMFIPAIAALSISLMGLAGALAAVGVAGTVALPGLLAIQAAGAVAGVVGGVIEGIFGGGENETTEGGGNNMDALLNEIKGLRTDLNSGKVAVYIDGKKVTGTVASVSSRATSNTYNR